MFSQRVGPEAIRSVNNSFFLNPFLGKNVFLVRTSAHYPPH